tara:strand:+ start:400 stop:726 length:327 start_codon:yes stop_codon:yes gene_type:complete
VELTNELRDLLLFINNKTHAVELLKFIDNHNGVVFSAIREHIDIPVDKRQNLAYPLRIMIDKGFIYKYKSHMKNWTMYGQVKMYRTTEKGKWLLKKLEEFSDYKEKNI